jgi:putative flippase GtrA
LPIFKQFSKFAAVGIASNGLLYISYLLLTARGIGHKTAMSVLYVAGGCLTFFLNRNWTFAHRGSFGRSVVAYFLIYLSGYLVNLSVLYVLVDRFEFNHLIVQGIMVFVIAILLFFLQKTIVFKESVFDIGQPAESKK